MARVLVVGGAGYIGGWLTDRAIEDGHDARVYDAPPQLGVGELKAREAEDRQGEPFRLEAPLEVGKLVEVRRGRQPDAEQHDHGDPGIEPPAQVRVRRSQCADPSGQRPGAMQSVRCRHRDVAADSAALAGISSSPAREAAVRL
jgi:hypothetical protein